ncbi:MAG: hypothetical protein ACFFCW_42495 [Candidatus Hodarchaeota archaeon]
MERFAIVILIIVFAFIIFLKQFKEKRIDIRLIICTSFPILLLVVYLANYEFFAEIVPPKVDTALAVLGLCIMLALILLRDKVDSKSLMILIGVALQVIALVSIKVFLRSHPVFSICFGVILLALGSLLFLIGLFYKIRRFLAKD